MADLRIFGKSAKGLEEITARRGGLSLAQRRLLILVDGVRDVDALSALLPSGLDEALLALESGGYIKLVGRSAPPDEPLAPIAIPEAEMTSVDEARLRAVRALNDLLGPSADDLAMAIEGAASGEELRPLIREAERLIASTHGAATAQAFILGVRRR